MSAYKNVLKELNGMLERGELSVGQVLDACPKAIRHELFKTIECTRMCSDNAPIYDEAA